MNDNNNSKREAKQDRLSAALRANLQKRKAQMRARRNSSEQSRADIPEDISEQRGDSLEKE